MYSHLLKRYMDRRISELAACKWDVKTRLEGPVNGVAKCAKSGSDLVSGSG